MFRNALVSVSDKSGLIDFLKPLQKLGLRIVSTGGTATHLKEHGLQVVDVSQQTHFPEVMDGRVKTLHPSVHMALLARTDNAADMATLQQADLTPFDLVIVNLYPFESAFQAGKREGSLWEYIDVGGPSMLRAAAKNHKSITVVCDPKDYSSVLEGRFNGVEGRRVLAAKVFEHTATYDSMIAKAMGTTLGDPLNSFAGERVQTLRYGENPHQKAAWLKQRNVAIGLHQSEILQGKELSYNNLLDLDSATRALRDIVTGGRGPGQGCVAVKHNSPCGAAQADRVDKALQQALSADPVSIFGGIVALSGSVTASMAQQLQSLFLECIVAPDFEPDAMKLLANKKNLRVLRWKQMLDLTPEWSWRSITGGALVQEKDRVTSDPASWTCWGETPNEKQTQELLFAWRVCAHLKSNAIAVTSGGQSVGLGMGQVNRVDAVQQALSRMQKFHPDAQNCVLASDAFFPFPDSVEIAHAAGIRWIIQPGGSVKDPDVRATAERLGVNIVLTGQRHFLH